LQPERCGDSFIGDKDSLELRSLPLVESAMPISLEDLLDAFDAAWQHSVRPRLEDFLPPRSAPEFREVLIGLVSIDLERRTKAGERVRVEEYLSRFPELRADDSTVLELVLLERDLRKRHDPAFETQEYPARFPELASRLEDHWLTVNLAPAGPECHPASAAQSSDLDLRDHVLLDRVGRGGMGEVYRGRDPALGRNLAVKVLRPELRNHPEAERRFQQEARINGLLQHPSIVPVHNLGRLSDGRLYFTMKLIRGRTLADILDQRNRIRQNAGKANRRSGECGDGLPELLGIFEKVVQALAYAHSRKVVHRDLKPANIMAGTFGEVQVMDWGLAKVLPRQEASEEPPAESTMGMVFATRYADATAPGNNLTGVVGTPAYMAPEQARGTGEKVDERADVFGLGGILCAILTGQAPYTGNGRDEVLPKAAAGDLGDAFSRLETSGADGELVQLARECLAARKEDRPRDAGAVSERLTAYLAGVQRRLRDAEVERAAAQARAEEAAKKVAVERRARRSLLVLAGMILLVLMGGIAGTTWGLWRAERAHDAEAKQRQLAEEKQREAESLAQRAAAEKERAQRAEAATLADFRASTDDAIAQLIGSKAELGPQEKSYLERMLKRWQAFASRTGDDERSRAIRAEGRFRVAGLQGKLGQGEEAMAGFREAVELYGKLAEEFPTVAEHRQYQALSHNNQGLLLQAQGKRAKAVEQYHKALANQQKLTRDFAAAADYRNDLATTHNNLATVLAGQHEGTKAEQHYREALTIREKLCAESPGAVGYRKDLAGTHNNLGLVLEAMHQPEKSAHHFHEALAIRLKLVSEYPHIADLRQELARTYHNLATLLGGQKQGAEAARHYRKALLIQEKLVDDFPAIPMYRHDLATTYSNQGSLLSGRKQRDEAAQQYHKAIANWEKLGEAHPGVPIYRKGLAAAHNNLGGLLREQKQWDKAEEEFRKALALFGDLARDFPTVAEYRMDLARRHNNLGALFEAQRQWEKAEQQHHKALRIQQKLVAESPGLPDYSSHLAHTHYVLGCLVADQRRLDRAAEHYREAVAVQQRLARTYPSVAEYRFALAASHNNLGSVLAQQKQREQSVEHYRKSLAIRRELTDEFPARTEYQIELGGSCCNFAHLLRDGSKPADSLPWYNRAIRTLNPVHERTPDDVTARLFLRNSYYGRALALDRMKQHDRAISDWTWAIKLSAPQVQPSMRLLRANSRVRAGQVAEAIAEVAEVRKSSTMTADDWYALARIYAVASSKDADSKKEHADQAMRMLRYAVQAGYKDVQHVEEDKDLDGLREREDFKKLMQARAKAKE
jgi:tetratricopeptide (TPR) repeat protein/tRNA A-37 threonylcarbamoyl transferase component Bud32